MSSYTFVHSPLTLGTSILVQWSHLGAPQWLNVEFPTDRDILHLPLPTTLLPVPAWATSSTSCCNSTLAIVGSYTIAIAKYIYSNNICSGGQYGAT